MSSHPCSQKASCIQSVTQSFFKNLTKQLRLWKTRLVLSNAASALLTGPETLGRLLTQQVCSVCTVRNTAGEVPGAGCRLAAVATSFKSRAPPPKSESRGESTEEEARAWVIHKHSRAKWGTQWPPPSGQRKEGRLASTKRDHHAFRQKDLITLSLIKED